MHIGSSRSPGDTDHIPDPDLLPSLAAHVQHQIGRDLLAERWQLDQSPWPHFPGDDPSIVVEDGGGGHHGGLDGCGAPLGVSSFQQGCQSVDVGSKP